ncbi:MAG: hypothetical protein GEU80_07380 [Dehalococcoidia bacterium]|nr:hypothetical protein [Dehalococcoidia bacterium]
MAQPQGAHPPVGSPGADTEAVARSYFERLINQHDVAFATTLFDPAIGFHDPAIPGGGLNGIPQVQRFFETFFDTFPDVHFEMKEFFVDGNQVAVGFIWTGTHRAKLFGITLSERHVIVPGIDIFHIANGRITSVQVAFDPLDLLLQFGGVRGVLARTVVPAVRRLWLGRL